MKFATCLIVLLLAAAFAPVAGAEECTLPADPAISVTIETAPVQHDRGLKQAELSKIPSASRRAGMEAYDRTLGLTQADIGAKADIDLFTVADGHGGYCTVARAARIALQWRITVHVAAEIPAGSCIDQLVSAHEEKHVAIDRELVPIARRAMELALTAVVRKSVYGPTLKDSQARLQEAAHAALGEAIDIFAVVRNRKQLALDSKDEYDQVPKTCGIIEYLRVMHNAQKKAGT